MAQTHSTGMPRLPTRTALCVHIVSVMLVQSTSVAVASILPILARRRFGASDLQTLLITAAVPAFLALSIFWGALLRRTSLRAYLLIYWMMGLLPLAFVAFAQSYWHVLACHLVAAVGFAAGPPVTSELLKRLYPDRWRGRAYAAMTAAGLVGGVAAAYGVGEWLSRDGEAFRIYMPAAALLQLVGIGILIWLASASRTEELREVLVGRFSLRTMLDPVLHMYTILRGDRIFFRYEAAFLTYGLGWMTCYALLPVLATDKLDLTYAEYQGSTQVVFQACMLLMILPMGWVIDHIGAVRTCGIAFLVLAFYPIGLMLATGAAGVGLASAVYGLAISGVQLAWTLGPVSFAPSAERVSQYAAIHATLVGVRGVLFQGLGVAVYKLSGGFTWPFALAAFGFLWASLQMWRLNVRMRSASIDSSQHGRTVG